jgi:STE24 endopeptidase
MAERPQDHRPLTAERLGVALVAVGALGFAMLAALLVPWHPVPGGSPDPVAASSVFTAAEISRAESYAHGARLIGWSTLGLGLLVSGWLGFTQRGARLTGRRRWPWPITVVVLTALVIVVRKAVVLPLILLAWDRRTDVGLTHQGLEGVLRDQAVSLVIEVGTSALALVILVGLARKLPRWWPVAAAALAAALVVGSAYVYPLLIEPAFNRFAPLPDGSLHAKIEALAETEGVEVNAVLVADASRRTTALNAYVSGFGSSRRVVLYDTTLELPESEVLAIVAHELAHARHRDVVTGTALGAAGAVAGMGLLALLIGSPGLRRRAGVAGLADPCAVALLLALSSLGTVVTAPLENAISRRIETRADVDALAATCDPAAFVSMQRSLALAALADPTPPGWSQWWFGSHPTVLERVADGREARRRRC